MDKIKELQQRIDDLEWQLEMLGMEEEEAAFKSDLYCRESFADRERDLKIRIEVTEAMLNYETARFCDPEEYDHPEDHCDGLYWMGNDSDKTEYYDTFCSHCVYMNTMCMINEEEV